MLRNKLGVLAVMVFLLAGAASATIMEKMTLQSLTNQSDRIILGQVSGLHTIVDRGNVWTIATITVEKKLKGIPASVVYFKMPGGIQIENGRSIVTEYEGVPRLEVLQRGVFFLEGTVPQWSTLTGLQQGLWKIHIHQGVQMVSASETMAGSKIFPLNKFFEKIDQVLKGRQR